MTRYAPGSTATAPRGRVTLAQAAELSGLSYAEIHRRCVAGLIPSAEQGPHREWSIRRTDALAMRRRELADDTRRALSQIRVQRERYAAWEREAAQRGVTVRDLAIQLLDAASGWRPGRHR